MCSYSAINSLPMSLNPNALISKLKEELGFDGFIISDYDEIGRDAFQGYPTSFIQLNGNLL